jgi:class 3 adenylate cyclase/tetratricopeptide (TPR) repeat protein
VRCPSCGSEVGAEARFCWSCGAELGRRSDERRLVTVLFADIVGFTGLSESRDPEQVKNAVDRCFGMLADDITSFGGRVDKVVGDAIIALFGAPMAHDDDAERAVRAALAMQDTVSRHDAEAGLGIRLRIGVNTGEVLVGGISAGDDYTAMGDVVNTASRLQTSAEPGTVVVGPETHAATVQVVHYRSLGRLHARGREESIEVWQALAPVGRPGERRSGPLTPLIGRDPELAVARESVAAAFGRSRAHLVALFGESGVGKTRLADEVAALARADHGALVLTGRCLPYGEANVWWPIAEAVGGAAGVDPALDDGEVRAAVTAAVREVLDAPDAIDRTVEGLLHLLGRPSALGGRDAERATEEATRAVRAFLHGVSSRTPVVLRLADLHWADEAVLRLLDETLERLGRRRVVVLVTARPTLLDRWAPRPGRFNHVVLSLDPLDDEATARLARELLGPDVDEALLASLIERSGGNPLFLEEMSRIAASDSGLSGLDTLPANVRSVIAARLDALDDLAATVVEDAAVLGLRGRIDALERMAEARGGGDLAAALTALDRADLLEVSSPTWSFRSNLVREVAYGRLTKTERALRHAGIAGWIEARAAKFGPEPVAHHYRRAALLAEELGGVDGLPADLRARAVDWTIAAARATSGVRASERAEHLYGEALGLLAPDDERRPDLLLDRAVAATALFRTATARRDIDEAEPLVAARGDAVLATRLELVRSEVAQWSGDLDGALDAVHAALGHLAGVGDPVLVGDAVRRAGMVQLLSGRHEEAESSITAAFTAYAEAGDPGGMAWARQNLAWISYVRGRMAEAEERLADATAVFEELGDAAGIAWSNGLLAYVRITEGRFEEAEALAREALADARERGDKWGQGMMMVALAGTALWSGRVDEAVRRAELARSAFAPGNDPVGTTQAVAVLGRALVVSGRVAEGFKVVHDALIDVGGTAVADLLTGALVSAAVSVGDVALAGRHLDRFADEADPGLLGGADRIVVEALVGLQSGDPGRAAALLEALPPPGHPDGTPWAWAVRSLVAAGTDEPIERLVEATETSARATYADRLLGRLAVAVSRCRAGDEAGTRDALADAAAAVPAGGDRVHPVVVAVAGASCLAALGTTDAGSAAAAAARSASAIGVEARGWHVAFADHADELAELIITRERQAEVRRRGRGVLRRGVLPLEQRGGRPDPRADRHRPRRRQEDHRPPPADGRRGRWSPPGTSRRR